MKNVKVVHSTSGELNTSDRVRRFVTELYNQKLEKKFTLLTTKGSLLSTIFSDSKYNGIVEVRYAEEFTRTRGRVNHEVLVNEFLKPAIAEKKGLIIDDVMKTLRFSDQGYSPAKKRLGSRAQDIFASLRYYNLNMFVIYDKAELKDMFRNHIGRLMTYKRGMFSSGYSNTTYDADLIKHLCLDYMYDTYYLNSHQSYLIFPESNVDKGINSYLSANSDYEVGQMTIDRKEGEMTSPIFDTYTDKNLGLDVDMTPIYDMFGYPEVTVGDVIDELPQSAMEFVEEAHNNGSIELEESADPRFYALFRFDRPKVQKELHKLFDDNDIRQLVDKNKLNLLCLTYCIYTKYAIENLDRYKNWNIFAPDFVEEVRKVKIKTANTEGAIPVFNRNYNFSMSKPCLTDKFVVLERNIEELTLIDESYLETSGYKYRKVS